MNDSDVTKEAAPIADMSHDPPVRRSAEAEYLSVL